MPKSPTMVAPKRPPIVPPTTAVWCFSFAQVSGLTATAVLIGDRVAIAEAATCVGSDEVEVDNREDEVGVDVAAPLWSEPSDVVVTLGADALLQQLLRSFGARQQ